MALVSSIAFVLTGLFIVWRGQGTEMAALGWMFTTIGVAAVAFHVYLATRPPPGSDG
jgi:hypothetical protein